jgi:hypothetical protein
MALVKAMKASYESGGLVKVIFDAIGEIVSGLIDIFHAVGLTIGEFFNVHRILRDQLVGADQGCRRCGDHRSQIAHAGDRGVKDLIVAAFYLIRGRRDNGREFPRECQADHRRCRRARRIHERLSAR